MIQRLAVASWYLQEEWRTEDLRLQSLTWNLYLFRSFLLLQHWMNTETIEQVYIYVVLCTVNELMDVVRCTRYADRSPVLNSILRELWWVRVRFDSTSKLLMQFEFESLGYSIFMFQVFFRCSLATRIVSSRWIHHQPNSSDCWYRDPTPLRTGYVD